ncbi:RING finger domain protein [Trichoderma parareesei]|uniref:RING-type E3 ubiquitin transferase n=1 Tax=Trichoderma parareesei TaxID=858221 RepID=A0A2H2Z6V6_TRIPA|nr:RING finger domain protein [Trichoderma parareesei]
MESGLADNNDELQRKVLQNTLQEVAASERLTDTNCCVICLDAVSDACELVPCGHDSFDYVCVLNWLYDNPLCPLCKRDVTKVHRGPPERRESTVIEPKPQRPEPSSSTRTYTHQPPLPRPRRRTYRTPRITDDGRDAERALAHRRDVYLHKRFSKHVGSNRLSLYRELTPRLFCSDEALVSRARMWIRRELQVFSFLSTDDSASGASNSRSGDANEGAAQLRRRANNAEFLLEYIIAILKTVDIMGSAGQAEDMISEFLGRDNARLFLHELRSWLRSPFTKLEDWDRAVQYDSVDSSRGSSSASSPAPRLLGRDADASSTAQHGLDRVRPRGDYYRPGSAQTFREERRKRRREHYRQDRRWRERSA